VPGSVPPTEEEATIHKEDLPMPEDPISKLNDAQTQTTDVTNVEVTNIGPGTVHKPKETSSTL
jgi:hypothetical protein